MMINNLNLTLNRVNDILNTEYELRDDLLVYNTGLPTEGTQTVQEINLNTLCIVQDNLETIGIRLTPMASHDQVYDIYDAITDLPTYELFIQSVMNNSAETPTGTLLTLLELVAQDDPYEYLQIIDSVDPRFNEHVYLITKE